MASWGELGGCGALLGSFYLRLGLGESQGLQQSWGLGDRKTGVQPEGKKKGSLHEVSVPLASHLRLGEGTLTGVRT